MKNINAESGRWLTNKSWIIIMVFIGTSLFYLGTALSQNSGSKELSTRINKVENSIIRQVVSNQYIKETLKDLKIYMREEFKDLRDQIRQNKK